MNSIILEKSVYELAEQISEKIFIQYLLMIRKQLEVNITAREIAASHNPAVQAKHELTKLLSEFVKPNTDDIFEKALDEILNELDQLRQADVGLVLVNEQTGKSVMPYTEGMMYTPPDYTDINGKTHKARPILHPGISSTVGLMAYQAERNREIAKKAQAPGARHAYEHVLNYQMIAVYASERLASLGVKIESDLSVPGVDFEFGREHIEGTNQSINLKCHRAYMYAAILATKIIHKYGHEGSCSFGMVHPQKNSKQMWYTVEVKFMSLSDPNH